MPKDLDSLGIEPGRPSKMGLWIIRKLVSPVVRLAFRPRIEGFGHLSEGQPFLLVSNHSGGLGLAEIVSFASLYAAYLEERELALAGFALPLGFAVQPTLQLHRMLGSVPSTYEHAYEALEKGVSLLIFPGGDHETLRPIWQLHRVDFNQRKGFLRIAREAGVSIVPMGIRGGHLTAPVLFRAKWMSWFFVWPRLFGLKRWGMSLLSLLGLIGIAFLPLSFLWKFLLGWLWAGSVLTFTPFVPATLRFRIGEPIKHSELFDLEAPESEDLQQAYDRVVGDIQALVQKPTSAVRSTK